VWDEVRFLLNFLLDGRSSSSSSSPLRSARARRVRVQTLLFVLALTLLSGLLSGAAAAQVKLDWQRRPGAEACPDATTLRDVVSSRVEGGAGLGGGAATRTLEGEVTPLGSGHRVHIGLHEQSGELIGERTLVDDAADCAALAEATALAVALLLESAAPPPSAPAPSAIVTPEPPLVRGERQARSHSRYQLIAGAVGSLALLPAPRAHALLGLRVALGEAYAVELTALGLGRAPVELGGESSGRAHFSTAHARLAACRKLIRSRLGLAACAGLIAGELLADGSGFSERDYHRRAPLVAGSARITSEVVLFGPLSASLALGLGVPFVHTRFVALDTNRLPRELASTRPLFGTLELGLAARF
jgi:hypothetical protein